MTDTASQAKLSTARIACRALWPSLNRALGSVCSVLSIPLLLLAAISATKLFAMAGLVQPHGWLAEIVAWQSWMIEHLRELLASLRIALPAHAFDTAFVYLFIGNAVARAERDELLAVELDKGSAWATLARAFRNGRLEFLFFAIPMMVRGIALRVLWPLAAIYRLGTPWVVDGPGLSGDEISTSVRRGDLVAFARAIDEAGLWKCQTVFDHRVVLLLQLLLGLAASVALQALANLL